MNELIKTLKNFLVRDLIYIIGGSTVIICLSYSFGILCKSSLPTPYYLFIVGIAYAIGYTIQEIFCILPFSTTTDYFKPNSFLRCVYRKLEHREWRVINEFDGDKYKIKIYKNASDLSKARLERITYLNQLGTTMGPCFIVSAIPILVRIFKDKSDIFSYFDLTIVLILILFGITLLILGWVKAMQKMKFIYDLFTDLKNDSNREEQSEQSA